MVLDLRSGEIFKNGRKYRLQDQPFRLLKLLVDHPGEVVSREELKSQLWTASSFGDFDQGLNKAIAKLRSVLDEPGAEVSVIETLPRRGYRLARTVEFIERQNEKPAVEDLPFRKHGWSKKGLVSLFAAASMLCLVVGGLWLRHTSARGSSRSEAIRSVAVLPLVNLSQDPSQEYFADGMTDELITALTRNTSLRIISRTSVMRYKGARRPLPDIAKEVGADGILEGSITRSSNRIHLSVQLVEGQKDTHIWAASYDRDLSDALSLMSELSRTIAREVNTATLPQPQPQKKISPEAYTAYLHGRDLWFHGDYEKAQDFYQEAVQWQPDYAVAWSGLGDCYTGLVLTGVAPTQEYREKAAIAARKGLELDDSIGETHKAVAAVQYFLEWNWKGADAESLRAIQQDPNSSEAHHLRSYVLRTLNRPEESLQEQKLASTLDPDLRLLALARAFLHLRRFEDAVQELRTREQAYPHAGGGLHSLLATAYYFAGMKEESFHEDVEVYRSNGDAKGAEALEREFKHGGGQAVALWMLNDYKKNVGRKHTDLYTLAQLYSRAGRKESALRTLENAYEEKYPTLVWLQVDPEFDILHSEPRYQTIVKKMGLPPLY